MPARRHLALVTAVLCAGLLSPASFAAEGGVAWVTVAPRSETFRVAMPGTPKRRVKTTSTFAGTVEDVSYRWENGGEVYLVTRVELPVVATFFMTDGFLFDQIRDSFLEKSNGTAAAYADVERQNHGGKRLDFTMDETDGARNARAEFFLVEGSMLSFTAMVPVGRPMTMTDRFFDSIELERED